MGIEEQIHKKAREPLQSALQADERILDYVTGNSKQTMVLTASRVIVIKPGIMGGSAFGAKVTSYPLNTISGIEHHKRLGTSFLIVRAAGLSVAEAKVGGGNDGYKLPNVIPIGSDSEAARFSTAVTARLGPQHEPSAASGTGIADEIAKLISLRDAGGLSESELEAAKAKLLS